MDILGCCLPVNPGRIEITNYEALPFQFGGILYSPEEFGVIGASGLLYVTRIARVESGKCSSQNSASKPVAPSKCDWRPYHYRIAKKPRAGSRLYLVKGECRKRQHVTYLRRYSPRRGCAGAHNNNHIPNCVQVIPSCSHSRFHRLRL